MLHDKARPRNFSDANAFDLAGAFGKARGMPKVYILSQH
jgi:hypothetical protein